MTADSYTYFSLITNRSDINLNIERFLPHVQDFEFSHPLTHKCQHKCVHAGKSEIRGEQKIMIVGELT